MRPLNVLAAMAFVLATIYGEAAALPVPVKFPVEREVPRKVSERAV